LASKGVQDDIWMHLHLSGEPTRDADALLI
jgi:hypothetical protein